MVKGSLPVLLPIPISVSYAINPESPGVLGRDCGLSRFWCRPGALSRYVVDRALLEKIADLCLKVSLS